MIYKQYKKFILSCDSCEEEVGCDSFDDAVDYKKDHKWKSIMVDGEWQDICPECQ